MNKILLKIIEQYLRRYHKNIYCVRFLLPPSNTIPSYKTYTLYTFNKFSSKAIDITIDEGYNCLLIKKMIRDRAKKYTYSVVNSL